MTVHHAVPGKGAPDDHQDRPGRTGPAAHEGKEEPGKGLGGQWEGFVITQELYEAEGKNTKFIPIVFSSADAQYIPSELRAATRYDLGTPEGYDKLFRRVTSQPARTPSPIA